MNNNRLFFFFLMDLIGTLLVVEVAEPRPELKIFVEHDAIAQTVK